MGSKKPCPGCGEVDQYRSTKEVCCECKRLLKMARDTEKRLDNSDDESVRVSIPGPPHWLPYIPHGYVSGQTEHSREFKQAFLDVVVSVGAFTVENEYGFGTTQLIEGSDGCRDEYEVSKATADSLRRLFASAIEMVKAGYENGYERGHNLLMGLAEGSTSINEFNERTIG